MTSKKLKRPRFEIRSHYNRRFSESFKKEKVKQIVEKQISIKELSEIYEVSRTAVYKWLYKYSAQHKRGTKQVIEMESEALKTKKLYTRVAELERIIGQKQLEIDFKDKLIELASEEIGYDIKKKHEQQPLNGSA
jgi:transposase